MQRIKQALVILASLLFTALSFSPALVLADCSNPQNAQEQIQCGANTAAGNNNLGNASNTLNGTVKSVISILSVIVGLISVIMIIVGGLRYTSSAGNPEAAKSARSTILYAILGLVIVALAQIIVHFVLNRVTTAAG